MSLHDGARERDRVAETYRFLRLLSASALKTVADPSFGGSVVRYPEIGAACKTLQVLTAQISPTVPHLTRAAMNS